MNPVLEAMNRLMPDYVRHEYPELFGWEFKLYDADSPTNDTETITLVGRNSMNNQMYRNSFAFSRRHLTQIGNLSDVYNEGFRKMMSEMRHEIIRTETINISDTVPELETLLNSLL